MIFVVTISLNNYYYYYHYDHFHYYYYYNTTPTTTILEQNCHFSSISRQRRPLLYRTIAAFLLRAFPLGRSALIEQS